MAVLEKRYFCDRERNVPSVFLGGHKVANECVLREQLVCAAAERPLSRELDAPLFAGAREGDSAAYAVFDECVAALCRCGAVRASNEVPGEWHTVMCATDAARRVNLRMIDPITFKVVRDCDSVQIDSVPYSRAFYECYEGAVYLHQAKPFLVVKLDLREHVKHTQRAPNSSER